MKWISLFVILNLLSCINPKRSEESIKTNFNNKHSSELPLKKIDTTYSPIIVKINSTDSIILRRIYFDHNNLNLYHYVFTKNGIQIHVDREHDFVENSKYNKVIKSGSSMFLFLENNGAPNFNQISAYVISKDKANFIKDVVYNDESQGGGPKPFSDIDHDGYLEFGGFDINEVHPSPDSMYYHPSEFYEIRNGEILFDSLLTKKSDIKMNGIYKKNPLNNDGSCCLVIKKPKR
ncbi:hypothetical protein DU508_12130 [Pedobacter chinensis]|uniref:Uncharacterized protein n=2 Tax=Pedobacter chinensis TaxID=2282421 RepID=A0A369Q014_9SPHI|nr:hypothetical protein DU508_12130 [Pedobacter chinensis]